MTYFEQRVDIDAPPAVVFDVLTDVERWSEWTESIRSIERLESGPLGEGSTARVHVAGVPAGAFHVTAFDRGRSFVWSSKPMPGVTTDAGHEVEAAGAGSRVKLWVRTNGPLAWLLHPVMIRSAKRNVPLEAAGLKRRSEARAVRLNQESGTSLP
jgi:hypothetical protein